MIAHEFLRLACMNSVKSSFGRSLTPRSPVRTELDRAAIIKIRGQRSGLIEFADPRTGVEQAGERRGRDGCRRSRRYGRRGAWQALVEVGGQDGEVGQVDVAVGAVVEVAR
jgi:hypothetical protein